MSGLRVSEIFCSLQGESRTAGLRTVFVRLTGCPLRCTWCDTAYAFSGGAAYGIDEVLAQVAAHKPLFVCVTGGEPLAQPECLSLLTVLCDSGYEVSLETSGALDISAVDARVSRVMDIKCPGSGESGRNRYENIPLLNRNDQLKFVLASRDDYLWARFKLDEYALPTRVGEVLFSPVHGRLAPAELAQWVIDDGLSVRMQLQLHKLIWGDARGR